jgi:hypothetical protein
MWIPARTHLFSRLKMKTARLPTKVLATKGRPTPFSGAARAAGRRANPWDNDVCAKVVHTGTYKLCMLETDTTIYSVFCENLKREPRGSHLIDCKVNVAIIKNLHQNADSKKVWFGFGRYGLPHSC